MQKEFDLTEALKRLDEDAEVVTVNDIVYGGAIVIVDDARTFDTSIVETELAKDYDDEAEWGYDETITEEQSEPTPRYILDKLNIEELLRKVGECSWFELTNNKKNIPFKRKYKITDDNVGSLLKQLRLGDYSYSLVSTNKKHKGALLHVFITSKPFEFEGETLTGLTLYIKIDFSDYGPICVVSLHPSRHEGKHPHTEQEDN